MKKYRKVMSHNTEECAKFEEKLILGSKNNMKSGEFLMWAVASLKVCTLMCHFSQ